MDGTERQARDDAERLEQMLRIWAGDDAAAEARTPAVAAAAIAAIEAGAARHGGGRAGPLAGGALAAAAAVLLVLIGWPGGAPPATAPRTPVGLRAGSGLNADAALASFALLYTPSWEEEQYL